MATNKKTKRRSRKIRTEVPAKNPMPMKKANRPAKLAKRKPATKNAKKKDKKETKSKRIAGKKVTPTRKVAKKGANLKKKLAGKKPAQGERAVKTKSVVKKAVVAKAVSAPRRPVRGQSQPVDTVAFSADRTRARSGGQSGDLQGLSGVEGADSESVDELLEEGNSFEADVVTGVEHAGNADEKEVRTHEVPEDDVPQEYLEKD